jgi:hypothetical protein
MLNKTEPVSLTISGGRVVGYTIRGFAPYPVESFRVTPTRISVRIGSNYFVSVTKTGRGAAFGTARGPLGTGTAALRRE